MTTPPINPAALRALAAYGPPARATTTEAQPPAPASGVAARDVVRRAPGLSVELTAEARAALIAIQSAASAPSAGPGPAAPDPAAPQRSRGRVPGARLNLTI